MDKFKVEKLEDGTIVVHISADTPVNDINNLVSALELKGVSEDLSKSTVSKRFFYRDSIDVADKLIKALSDLTKQSSSGKYALDAARQAKAERKKKQQDAEKLKAKQVNVSKDPVQPNTLPDTFENRLKLGPGKSGWLTRSENQQNTTVEKSNYKPKDIDQCTLNEREQDAIDRLTVLMHQKSMFNSLQPSSEDFIKAGENMGIGLSKEHLEDHDSQWGNSINNWLQEATKPLSKRFSSAEEELKYWQSIKISSSDDESAGY
jgi:hypothetical protein